MEDADNLDAAVSSAAGIGHVAADVVPAALANIGGFSASQWKASWSRVRYSTNCCSSLAVER
jgi:hypothetical protein